MKTCLSNCPWEAVSAYYSIIFHWCWSEVAQGLACTHFTETRYQQSYLPKPQVWEWDWTSEILPNTCNTTCSSQRDRGQRGEGVGNQEAGAEKEGRGCVKQRGGRTMRGTCPFTLNRSQGIAKKPRNHSATRTAISSNGFFGQPGF